MNNCCPAAEFDAPPAAKVVVPEEAMVRDSILVTDADSATGELVVLRLILARHVHTL